VDQINGKKIAWKGYGMEGLAIVIDQIGLTVYLRGLDGEMKDRTFIMGIGKCSVVNEAGQKVPA